MVLYKINENIEYIETTEKPTIVGFNIEELLISYFSTKKLCWSDKEGHEYFSYSKLKNRYRKLREWRILEKHFSRLPFKTRENGEKYLAVNHIKYVDGYFLKKRFYNKRIPYVICTTKKEMENFFRRYIDYSTDSGQLYTKSFLKAWQENSFFVCYIEKHLS